MKIKNSQVCFLAALLRIISISVLFLFFPLFNYAQQVDDTEINTSENYRLNSFTIKYFDGKAYIKWVVIEPDENIFYMVERSADNLTYEVVNTKKGTKSPNNIELMHSFTDTKPLPCVSYYRIKRMKDDSYTTSDAVMINNDKQKAP